MIQSVDFDTNIMRTNIQEKKGQILIEIELPGYNRENIQAQLEKGYLTIIAVRNEELTDLSENTHYILKERKTGEMKRTFYVGEEVRHEDISAQQKNGVLSIIIVKRAPAVEGERRKLIPID